MELTEEDVLSALNKREPRMLAWVCEWFGIKQDRNASYSSANYKRYIKIGQILQRLKRQGKVVYVGGKGAGWRLA